MYYYIVLFTSVTLRIQPLEPPSNMIWHAINFAPQTTLINNQLIDIIHHCLPNFLSKCFEPKYTESIKLHNWKTWSFRRNLHQFWHWFINHKVRMHSFAFSKHFNQSPNLPCTASQLTLLYVLYISN